MTAPSLDFQSLQDQISSSLVTATRTAGQISAEDLSFHRSLNPALSLSLDKENVRLLSLANRLVRAAASGSEIEAPQLEDADALENNWRGVVDVIDKLLERADTSLDEYTGVIKRLSPSQQDQNTAPNARKPRPANILRTQNIPKPQLQFETIPSNDETTPFKPLLNAKPHAILPLEESLTALRDEDGVTQYSHPYETEICQFQYPPSTYKRAEPIASQPLEKTRAIFVDTPEAVSTMLAELKTAHEIAIDLEHHDARSYTGMVSLMQISTREKDWIVDTLKPWRRKLQVLNEVFSDPSILKVLHGAFMDIIWLQRDLGLYIVGLFDTFHAARALEYPKASLASLLSRFVQFDADKQYQMADWRIRPLPEEMFNYARSDTHFLLYVFDNMRNELIQKSDPANMDQNLIETVLQNSKETALQRYERAPYDAVSGSGPSGWYGMLERTPALFSKEQFAVFTAVHQWRDQSARENDESLHFVMPKHVIFSIARAMPMDMASLLNVAQPISKLVRMKSVELLGVIKRAKDVGTTGPDMTEVLRPRITRERGGISTLVGQSATPLPIQPLEANLTPTAQNSSNRFPIRTDKSRFWGSAFGSSVWEIPKQIVSVNEGLRLALPLPQLTAEIFENSRDGVAPESQSPTGQPGALAEHQYTKDRKPREDIHGDTFTIKQLGGSRKRKDEEAQEHNATSTTNDDRGSQTLLNVDRSNEDEMLITANEEEDDDESRRRAREKAALKAERKAQKKADKERRKRGEAVAANGLSGDQEKNPNDSEPHEAFDYANAESVLHAKKEKADRTGSKKSFDPYAKSANAPKGVPRAQKEKAGRSFTFKN
ncbi:MAG: exosome nuclease subunit [Pycnora praestabilis]|nr:MAG: exosome nuclease subunit [Pycnora praestabilis]